MRADRWCPRTLSLLIITSLLLVAGAQGLPQVAVLLRPVAGSGVAGIARIMEKGGVVSVGVNLAEAHTGETYLSSIYEGVCPATADASLGAVVPYNPEVTGTRHLGLADGQGLVANSGDLFGTLTSLRDGHHVIATRVSTDPSGGQIVACGDIPPLTAGVAWPPFGVENAWAILRAALPPDLPLYRPTWLPARFRWDPLPPMPMPYFGVTYESEQGDLLVFAFGPTNFAEPTRVAPISVHGITGQLSEADGSPPSQVSWIEHGELYSVRAERGTGSTTISHDELLKIVANLAPFGPDAASQLPRTGEEPGLWPLTLGGVLLLAGVALRRRAWRRRSTPGSRENR